MKSVTLIGLGYVGLPAAIEAVNAGYEVRGFDTNKQRINLISIGESYIEGITNTDIFKMISTGRFKAVCEIEDLTATDVYIICVPTPLDMNKNPDLQYLIDAVDTVAKVITPGALILIESTVAPGTVRKLIVPRIVNRTGLPIDEFQISYSPERIDPGNVTWKLSNTPKLVSGIDRKSLDAALKFYSKFIKNTIECSSIEVAETSKLLENTFRFVNISFINELTSFCEKLNISILEVIEAASSKPYGFMPFYPSVGVGGHCIPVDSLYLAHAGRSIGIQLSFIDLANKVNQEMPYYFIGRAEEKLKGLENKRILVVGVSYKPNISDVRESPIEFLLVGLKKKGADVYWHDDLVKEWNGKKSVLLSNNFDLAILATHHDYIDLKKLGSVPILDTRSSI